MTRWKLLLLPGLVILVPVAMYLIGQLAKSETPTTTKATHRPALAWCLDDSHIESVSTFSQYFDLVGRCTAQVPDALRTAAKASVEEPRERRAALLLAAARNDVHFRSVCDVDDARAADPLLAHPSFHECAHDVFAYKLDRTGLECSIDIGTYVFLDVLAAHLRDDPGGPWLIEGKSIWIAVLIENEHRDCPGAVKDAGPPARTKPAAVTRTGKVWPFHAWDRGEAVTFNQFGDRPGVGLYAYDADGWSEHLVDRKNLVSAQAKQALDLLNATEGGIEVSKCPFPRHAVILYDGDVPVASINVCFECGDILIWPKWPGPELASPGYYRQLALYKQTFPKWKTFFRDDVGFVVREPR